MDLKCQHCAFKVFNRRYPFEGFKYVGQLRGLARRDLRAGDARTPCLSMRKAVLLAVFACMHLAALAQAFDLGDARNRLFNGHISVEKDSAFYRELLHSPIAGDTAALALVIAQFELLGGYTFLDKELLMLRAHRRRLAYESALGRPSTRVADVQSVLDFEKGGYESLQSLANTAVASVVVAHPLDRADQPPPVAFSPNSEKAVNWVAVGVQLKTRPGMGIPVSFDARLPSEEGRAWLLHCKASGAPAPRRDPSHMRYDCEVQGPMITALGEADRALDKARRTPMGLEVLADSRGSVVDSELDDPTLPYQQAVERIEQASCMARGACLSAFSGVVSQFNPTVLAVAVGMAILLVAGMLSRRPPPQPTRATTWGEWGGVVVLGALATLHVAVIGIALDAGATFIVLVWLYLGLQVMLPGALVGALAVRWGIKASRLRFAKIAFGLVALTAPALEWVLFGILRSGYGG